MIFESFEKIAVLIDADNAQASKIEDVLKTSLLTGALSQKERTPTGQNQDSSRGKRK